MPLEPYDHLFVRTTLPARLQGSNAAAKDAHDLVTKRRAAVTGSGGKQPRDMRPMLQTGGPQKVIAAQIFILPPSNFGVTKIAGSATM